MNRNVYKIRQFKPADQVAVIDLWKICKLIRPWNSPEKDIQRELDVQSDLVLVLEIRKNIIETWYSYHTYEKDMISAIQNLS